MPKGTEFRFVNAPSNPRSKAVPVRLWNEHHVKICLLYSDPMLRLDDVMRILADEDGFVAT